MKKEIGRGEISLAACPYNGSGKLCPVGEGKT
jgi:hypothetical protein